MERSLNQVLKQLAPTVRPIITGGTGATDKSTAISNLGGIPLSTRGIANGIAPLNTNNKIPLQYFPDIPSIDAPALEGSGVIYVGETDVQYEITNYNTNTTYNISVTRGTFVREEQYIYVTPNAGSGISIITINGRNYPITVLDPYLDIPVITYPQNNIINIPRITTVSSSITVHGINEPLFDDIHWQLSLSQDFSGTLEEEYHGTSNNDQEWDLVLSLNTDYYVRVRYYHDVLGWSPWSNVVKFKTRQIPSPYNETAIVYQQDLTQNGVPDYNIINGGYGESSITISDDDTVMIVSDQYATFSNDYGNTDNLNAHGALYIYKKINNNWVQQRYLISTNIAQDGYFGFYHKLSQDKQTLLVAETVTSYPNSTPPDEYLSISIFRTTVPDDYSTLTLVDKITNISDNNLDMVYCDATPNFEKIILCTLIGTNRCVKVLSFDGTNITLSDTINQLIDEESTSYGYGISISTNGLRIAINDSSNFADDTHTRESGCIWIYEYSTGSWNLTQRLAPPPDVGGTIGDFGFPVILSPDGTQLITASTLLDNDSHNNVIMYIYTYQNNEFVLLQTITTEFSALSSTAQGGFFEHFSINNAGNLLLVSSPSSSTPESFIINGHTDNSGVAYLLEKDTNGNWLVVKSYFIPINQQGNGIYFGAMVALSGSGNTAAISHLGFEYFNIPENAGIIRIFE